MAGDVVAPAQQRQVVEVGLAAVQPVHEMVHVAPGGGRATPGVLAVLVADHDHAPEAAGYGAGLPPVVEDLRRPAHDDAPERAVAEQALGGDAGNRTEALDVATEAVELRQRAAGEHLVARNDVGVRTRRPFALRLHQPRISSSLRERACVGTGRVRWLRRVERARDDRRGLRVEKAPDDRATEGRQEVQASTLVGEGGVLPGEFVVGERAPSSGDDCEVLDRHPGRGIDEDLLVFGREITASVRDRGQRFHVGDLDVARTERPAGALVIAHEPGGPHRRGRLGSGHARLGGQPRDGPETGLLGPRRRRVPIADGAEHLGVSALLHLPQLEHPRRAGGGGPRRAVLGCEARQTRSDELYGVRAVGTVRGEHAFDAKTVRAPLQDPISGPSDASVLRDAHR